MKFTLYRIINALVIFASSFLLALYFGAQLWSDAVYLQTIITFLPLLTFGYNEGFGLWLPSNTYHHKKLFNLVSISCFITSIIFLVLLVFVSLDILDGLFLVLPFGMFGALLFSLSRMYFRGVGDLKGLSKLYITNSLLIILASVVSLAFNSPVVFVLMYSISQMLSFYICVLLKLKVSMSEIINVSIVKFKFSYLMARKGISVLLSGVLFEAILNIDKYIVLTSDIESELGVVGIALVVSKGVIMIISIINTINYRPMNSCIDRREKGELITNIRKQVLVGLLCSLCAFTAYIALISTSYFVDSFPSFSSLNIYALGQSGIVMVFAFIIPMSTFMNFYYGGTVYFKGLLKILIVMFVMAIYCSFVGCNIIYYYMASVIILTIYASKTIWNIKSEVNKW